METSMIYIFLLGFLWLWVLLELTGLMELESADESLSKGKLIRWLLVHSRQYEQADIPSNCCNQVKRIGKNPSCLCAVMLSDTSKSAGVKPEIAITIPKRCNLADRPVGYQCGAFTLP